MALFLVSHGRTSDGELDPSGFDEVWALRDRLPQGAAWFCAPDPASVATCQLLTEGEVGVAAHLRPDPGPGEDGASALERVLRGVRGVLASHPGEDVVLVGDGPTWLDVAERLAPRGGADARRVLGTPGVLTLVEPLTSA